MLVKVFHAGFVYQSNRHERLLKVVIRKPSASRSRSKETYLLASAIRP
ncbi:hypothetical protein PGH44_00025 [Legionella pneumophila]|nr:hypothetical protein PGH44_00025 [Legionella pneumophila]